MANDTPSSAIPADLPYAPSEEIGSETPPVEFRRDQVERALFEIQSEQNLVTGALAGGIAGAVGAILWAVITVATGFQIGWLAVGIGFLVGASVRWAGRGTTATYGVIGAGLSLVSVVVGNFLSLLGLMAGIAGISYLEMITSFDYTQTYAIMAGTFEPIDLLFYGVAIWQGYQCSIRKISDAEIHDRLTAEGVSPVSVR